jgi:hypothetical protein
MNPQKRLPVLIGVLFFVVCASLVYYDTVIKQNESAQENKPVIVDEEPIQPAVDETPLPVVVSPNEVSCNFPADARRGNYFVTIRVPDADIVGTRDKITELLKQQNGSVSNLNEDRGYDAQAGTSLTAGLFGSIPVKNIDSFVSEAKQYADGVNNGAGYTENEYYNVYDISALRRDCMSYTERFASLENQESLLSERLKQIETLTTDDIIKLTEMLMSIQSQANAEKSSIRYMWDNLNKVEINIDVKRIPG